MANTLNLQFSWIWQSGDYDRQQGNPISLQIDCTGAIRVSAVATIGTVEETLSKGDISTIGYVIIRNLDSTNYVTVGTTTSQRGIKIEPGEFAVFRAAANNVYIAADTASVNVAYEMYSD